MQTLLSYIQGEWTRPQGASLDVHNPATEEVVAHVVLGTAADVDKAIASARKAFEHYGYTSFAERLAYVEALRDQYAARIHDIADAMRIEMGAPKAFALESQAGSGLAHFDAHLQAARKFDFEYHVNNSRIVHEPIGIAALITPWNWPMNQLVVKVIPALLSGCTMVVKPSEISPLSAQIFTEVVHAAKLPPGVFNLLHGDGAGVGSALSSHRDVDMVSFTGSARAGVAITTAAAPTIKRVTLELGGKSPNLILDDADLEEAVQKGVQYCMNNTGQNCDAPSRMYVPAARYEEALHIAKAAAEALQVGDPAAEGTDLGPLVSQMQYDRVQAMIQMGIDEGATVMTGGVGKPSGLERG
jgi:aldehyde dehydrogenase (NAD+)